MEREKKPREDGKPWNTGISSSTNEKKKRVE